jgi:membrane protease YdiL (CAAX protease family)
MKAVFLFLAILFAFTWWGFTTPVPTDSVSSFLNWFLPIVWAPTIIAFVLVAGAHGIGEVAREWRAQLSWPTGATGWLFAAATIPAAAVVSAVLIARAAGHDAAFIPASAVPQMVGIQVITGAVGEELGWRGFLLPRLQARMGVVRAAWMMGVLWGLWHLPAFFTPGLPHRFMPMPLVLPLIATFGVFMALVFNRTGGSVLATMAAHLSLNISSGIGGTPFSSPVFWGALLAIMGTIAIVGSVTWVKHGGSTESTAPTSSV